jgi:hypothetical protein
MADPPGYPGTRDDSDDRRSVNNTRRWAAPLAITLAIVLVLLFVVLHITGTLGPGAH